MACYDGNPSANLRCIVFTLIVALGYWFLPKKNKGVMIGLGIFAVLSLLLYDSLFKCSANIALVIGKYVVYVALLCSLYWCLPKKNKWILLLCLFVPYILLAWHDYLYNCKRTMGPTYLSWFYAWAKPPESKQIKDYKNLCPRVRTKINTVNLIVLITIIVAAPFFILWKPKK